MQKVDKKVTRPMLRCSPTTRPSQATTASLGNGSVADIANTVSIGAAGSERKLVNLANGTIANNSTDAVNGAQLFATNPPLIHHDRQSGVPLAIVGGDGKGGGTAPRIGRNGLEF